MKRLTLTLALIFTSLLSGLWLSGVVGHAPKPVEAQGVPPLCYTRHPPPSDNPNVGQLYTTLDDCFGNPNFNEILKNVRNQTLQGGQCYIIEVNVPGITAGDPLDSDVCQAAHNALQSVQASTPPNSDPVSTPSSGTTTTTTPSSGGATAPSGNGDTTAVDTTKLPPGSLDPLKTDSNQGTNVCGGPTKDQVKLSINLGCTGKGEPIVDLLFAIIRLLSVGVGFVIVGSTIVAGIQYVWSRGNPQEVEKAKMRIISNLIALLIFIFSFAILNWLVPKGILKG